MNEYDALLKVCRGRGGKFMYTDAMAAVAFEIDSDRRAIDHSRPRREVQAQYDGTDKTGSLRWLGKDLGYPSDFAVDAPVDDEAYYE